MAEKAYNLQLNNRSYRFLPDNHIAHLHREEAWQDADFIRFYDHDIEKSHRIFGKPDLVRWMAGLAFKATGMPYIPKSTERRSFGEHFGWFSTVVIRDKPMEEDQEAWIWLSVNSDLHEDGSFTLPDEDDE